jgi:hypothetical protein
MPRQTEFSEKFAEAFGIVFVPVFPLHVVDRVLPRDRRESRPVSSLRSEALLENSLVTMQIIVLNDRDRACSG